MSNIIEFGDCREIMRRWKEQGVKAQMCVTSPPYFGLRSYLPDDSPDKPLEIGLEETPDQYVARMVEVFRCVRDVLSDDGTLWLNIGDSYAAQRGGTHQPAETLAGGKGGKMDDGSIVNRDRHAGYNPTRNAAAIGLKHKDLIGIPWRLAFALQSDGWYLRQDIIWHKPNPMPESVKDRCTKAHEYVFLLSKSERYYYDAKAIAQPIAESSKARLAQPNLPNQKGSDRVPGKTNGNMKAVGPRFGGSKYGDDQREESRTKSGNEYTGGDGLANRRSVWTVATKPFNGKKALTDYVGDDGKPYTASPDCPIHGHLARRQTSGTPGYGGQQGLSQTGSAGTCAHPDQSPACGEKSTTSHNSQASAECNSRLHTTGSSHENKTDSRLNGHTLGDGNQSCSGCKSVSGEHQDCGKDCSCQNSSSTATFHNTGTSKMVHALATTQPCMPCAETGIHTQSTQDQRGLFEQGHGTCENNILTDGSDVRLSQDIHSCNIGKSSELASMAYKVEKKCTCNEVIIDHFATFPPALIEPCILAGSRTGDVVLDPFMGSGTTAAVAIQHGRKYLGCELNPDYGALQQQRIAEAQAKIDDSTRQSDLFSHASSGAIPEPKQTEAA